jgi:primosomal protein N' (replication factor Y)
MVGDPTAETGEAPGGDERILVSVAVDAPGGAGARPYTYHLDPDGPSLGPGDAVLVDFGRRQAVGVILGPATGKPAGPTKPVRTKIRTDGPLLPPLTLALVDRVARHYLAPPAAVIRAALPPGFLERLELVAEATVQGSGAVVDDPVAADLLATLVEGSRRVRDLPAHDGRPALLRRLRALAGDGLVELDWTLEASSAGPRYERWLMLTPEGAQVVVAIGRGEPSPAGRVGPRQLAALDELAAAPGGIAGPGLASRHGAGALAGLVRRGLAVAEVRERERRPLAARPPGSRGARPVGAALTAPQAEAVAGIRAAIEARDPTPFLLDGVTGSGKTAIYVEAIAAVLDAGRSALVLVPEVAMAVPLVDRLRADLGVEVALLHSALGDGERADEWRRIRAGEVDVVVGTRVAVLAPLADPGLVIVDEEHEPAYKSDRTPRLQARDVAVQLGRLAGAPVVLGSATPSVETVGRSRAGQVRRVGLPERPVGRPPAIEVVDLRAELASGNRGLLSAALAEALEALEPDRGDRAILVINRRGSASVVLCRDCGHVQACPECGRPLVFHQAGYTLRCHHCGVAAPLASRCPACGSARIRYLGGGTERVEREVRDRFPGLRVGRLDRDVVARRGMAQRVLDDLRDGRIDVLVGTSLVAKGIDVPEVVLVGVVSADVALNLPDERAAERTFQLLAQAVGRAGRGERPGRAIIQSYQPDHPAIRAVVTGDASAFYDAELDLRRRFGSPPFGRLVKLTIGLPDRAAAEQEAAAMAQRLRDRAGGGVAVMGPAPAYVARRSGRWRYNVILRGDDPAELLGEVGAPWSIDVDPESLL